MTAPARYTCNPDLVIQELDNETFLLNPATGDIYGLDRVSTRVWTLIGELGERELVRRQMLIDFEVDPAELDRDLDNYFAQLISLELISVRDEGIAP